mmetsp:Transcript_15042/g.47249  ORF Transcript_15042/g.47249 Transcript_15042/m.47249 type:complete len:211 (+) Transcript_15042:8-640(+)|eukprot:CAMPEP_0204561730 /NCGR_PEP_ID=MMETSP0661-20131031/33349_1 /ASSEMBLY_ACC=CAM_ASM_000606 /TAXON_ID=109239 /ORGANISM="Alexandrium margalefi, Strain AMGDE01CS-322" /LENGTH=210 /DNA_ID=CAMNT_0051569163 /DNA_START=12 /DNA_END=644 /DNA_ORIENTATION=-
MPAAASDSALATPSLFQAYASEGVRRARGGGAVEAAAEQLVSSRVPLAVLQSLDVAGVLQLHHVPAGLRDLRYLVRVLVHPGGRHVLGNLAPVQRGARARAGEEGRTGRSRGSPLEVPRGLVDGRLVAGSPGPADVLGEVRLRYPGELDDALLLPLGRRPEPARDEVVELRPEDVVQGLLGLEVHVRREAEACLQRHLRQGRRGKSYRES